MVTKSKFLRKQGVKAERAARLAADTENSEEFLALAKAYRSQPDVLKAKKLNAKKLKANKRAPKAPLVLAPDPKQVYFHEAEFGI